MPKVWSYLLKRIVQMNEGLDKKDLRIKMMDDKMATDVVGYHRFMLKYPKNRKLPICIVEGEDEKYYGLRVKIICNNLTPVFIVCEGKKGVKDTFDLISSKKEYREGKIFYFVDRDFDALIENTSIYETPYYSIENFYTGDETFSCILRNQFKLNEDDEEYRIAMDLFKERQREFHESTRYFNSWILLQRQLSSKGKMSRLNLSNINIKNFVSINLNRVIPKYDINKIHNYFSGAYKLLHEQVQDKFDELEDVNYQQVFRGKFEIQFLEKFLELIQEDIGSPEESSVYFKEKRSVSLNFYDIVSQFSSFAETPDCLVDYIKNIWSPEAITVN